MGGTAAGASLTAGRSCMFSTWQTMQLLSTVQTLVRLTAAPEMTVGSNATEGVCRLTTSPEGTSLFSRRQLGQAEKLMLHSSLHHPLFGLHFLSHATNMQPPNDAGIVAAIEETLHLLWSTNTEIRFRIMTNAAFSFNKNLFGPLEPEIEN